MGEVAAHCPECAEKREDCECPQAWQDVAAAYAPGGRIYEQNRRKPPIGGEGGRVNNRDLWARVEALTWNPPTRDAVSGRVDPPKRKVHVRVRDLLAVLRVPTSALEGADLGRQVMSGLGRTAPPPTLGTVEVVRGWRFYNDGTASPLERWVRHADGDWVSLDSERRTSGDILMDFTDEADR